MSRAPSWLPAALRERVDVSELAVLPPREDARRRQLEALLDAHVVAYRLRATPDRERVQLCSVLEPAPLSESQVAFLRAQEERGIVLVAYAKPARLREDVPAAWRER